jgi:hypothetical protein
MIGAPISEESLTLYGSFTSSSSYKPMLYLALAGLPFSFRTVNLKIRAGELLLVEPDVFHAPAVEDAVGHDRPPLDMRLPAGRAAVVKNDRPSASLYSGRGRYCQEDRSPASPSAARAGCGPPSSHR